jgi:hypothetical protein
MSRSTRYPVTKIGAKGDEKALLNRQIRRSTKNSLRSQDPDESLDLPNSKSIVNDYDYVDKVIKENEGKFTRK